MRALSGALGNVSNPGIAVRLDDHKFVAGMPELNRRVYLVPFFLGCVVRFLQEMPPDDRTVGHSPQL